MMILFGSTKRKQGRNSWIQSEGDFTLKKICLILAMVFLLCGCKTEKAIDKEFTTALSESIISTDAETPSVYIVQRNEFDENGKILKEIYFDVDTDGVVYEAERIEYNYDNAGNLIAENTFWDSSTESFKEKSFEYDGDNRLLNVYSYDYLSERYIYDEQGNLTNKYCYDSNGNLTDYEEYVYKNSVLSTSSYMYSDNESFEDSEGNYYKVIQKSYVNEEYDDSGKLSKVTSFYYNEEPYYELYTYNDYQTIIQEYSFDGTTRTRIVFDYDNQNRKVRHTVFDSDGEIWFMNEYEYTDFSCTNYSYNADRKLEHSHISKWDEQNRQIFEASYDAEGKLQASWEYIYDEYGYISSIVNTDQDGNVEIEIAPHRDFYSNGSVKTEVFYSNEDYIALIYRNRY